MNRDLADGQIVNLNKHAMRVIVQGLCKQGNYARLDFLGQDFTEVGNIIRFACLDNNWRMDS